MTNGTPPPAPQPDIAGPTPLPEELPVVPAPGAGPRPERLADPVRPAAPAAPPAVVEVTPEQAAAVAAKLGVAPEDVAAVLAALDSVRQGDLVGTVRFDATTGTVSHRVRRGGVLQWAQSTDDGGFSFSIEATAPGEVIRQP